MCIAALRGSEHMTFPLSADARQLFAQRLVATDDVAYAHARSRFCRQVLSRSSPRRIEHFVQGAEVGAMEVVVDLHAADVDEFRAASLCLRKPCCRFGET